MIACNTKEANNKSEIEDTYIPPKTEQITEFYPSGIKKIEGKLIDGKRHGKWIYYYENGFIWSEGVYKNGIRNGYALVYYPDGAQKISGQYKKNLRVEVWKVFNTDGTLIKAINLNEMLTKKDSTLLELKQ